ncbi:DUF3817 domain-containing protein [Paenibacillus xylanexedens]|uniref:DUF3817 domain-containing protein n=1 Tax=Paenibacillus xylanexedens TaxID=528191 RepID=UPI001C8EB24A|nr:DUF3817 domain-containing protein [Paenibacillus xylanexedens]MBY0119391.1 DUF3817 domain-containing protein [Paenibacillus xylanexedens]
MLHSTLGRFRLLLWLQGISYVLLLFVAFPLRDAGVMPQAVTWFGNLYGFLFLMYLLFMVTMYTSQKWRLRRPIALFFVSFIPLGNMIYDVAVFRKLYRQLNKA